MFKFALIVIFGVFIAFPSLSFASTPIYTYHYVGFNPNPGEDETRDGLTTSPKELDEHLKRIKDSEQTTIFFEDFEKPIKNPIILTFDDGYVDFYINAYPLLRKYNLRAVQFISTGLIGKSGYLTWDMIEDMQESGLISFQSHTVNHPNLTLLTYPQILEELMTSKKVLEEKTGEPVDYLAYPYGSNNFWVQLAAKQAGYKASFSTWNGLASELNYNTPRLSQHETTAQKNQSNF